MSGFLCHWWWLSRRFWIILNKNSSFERRICNMNTLNESLDTSVPTIIIHSCLKVQILQKLSLLWHSHSTRMPEFCYCWHLDAHNKQTYSRNKASFFILSLLLLCFVENHIVIDARYCLTKLAFTCKRHVFKTGKKSLILTCTGDHHQDLGSISNFTAVVVYLTVECKCR